MPKDLSTHNDTEIALNTTRPHFLFQIDFTPVLRLSSRSTVTFDLNSYTGAHITGLEYSHSGDRGSFTLFDEDSSYVGEFVSEGASGVAVQVWVLYGDPPWSAGEEDLVLSGELGPSREKDGFISVAVLPAEFRFAPNIYYTQENGLNHLPPHGTRVTTRDGIEELRNV